MEGYANMINPFSSQGENQLGNGSASISSVLQMLGIDPSTSPYLHPFDPMSSYDDSGKKSSGKSFSSLFGLTGLNPLSAMFGNIPGMPFSNSFGTNIQDIIGKIF